MNALEMLNLLTEHAKKYSPGGHESVVRNSHMHDADITYIDSDVVDAVVVDFINSIGMRQCVDYALNASDLHDEKKPSCEQYEKTVEKCDSRRKEFLDSLKEVKFGKNPLVKSVNVSVEYFTHEELGGR